MKTESSIKSPVNNEKDHKDYTNFIEVSAPSNIALIKYMGKVDTQNNRPTNSSLSWTLENLRTFVQIRARNPDTEEQEDVWSPLVKEDLLPLDLSAKGRAKFLNFFKILKFEFKIQGFFEIKSANNFPSDCGLASSASSFAALTLAAYKVSGQNYLSKELARLSQKGSGSSCRSFFSPWSLWHSSGAEEIQIPINKLKHQVILCDETQKTVSSSEAHVQVLTSDLFLGRPERAEKRLQDLIQALRNVSDFDKGWKRAYEICWNEFWDMHTLFHTSKPAFMYMNHHTMKALNELLKIWSENHDGPLVTMDAGSNIHLLFRDNQVDLYQNIFKKFNLEFNMWTDEGYFLKKTSVKEDGE